MDLNETIRLCQLGDKEAFRTLFESVEKKAMSTAYLISGHRGIAEDILQESYIKCFREIKKLKNPRAFNVWFYRILVRTGWDLSKKYSRVIPMNPEDISICIGSDDTNSIDYMLDMSSEYETLKSAIDGLSHKLRETVILYYYNELSIDEISNVQGVLAATVKTRLFYARNKLKKIMEESEKCNTLDVEYIGGE